MLLPFLVPVLSAVGLLLLLLLLLHLFHPKSISVIRRRLGESLGRIAQIWIIGVLDSAW